MLGRRPALRASAQSATGSFSFKNENERLSLLTASAWAPSCSPSPDRALRRRVTRPSVLPGPWIPGCPLVPVHCRAHCVHVYLLSDIWGLTHPGRETAQGPPSPSGVHPQAPLSTAHAKPEHLRARCQATEGSPEAPGPQELLERAGLKLCALPCPCRTDPQARLPPPAYQHWCPGGRGSTVYRGCTSSVTFARPGARAPTPSTEALAGQPRCRAGCRGRPAPTGPHLRPLLGPDADLAVAAFLRVQGAHEGPDGRPSDHVHRDAALRQGPDDTHLRAAPTPTGAGSQRPLCPPGPRTAVLSCPHLRAHVLHTLWEVGQWRQLGQGQRRS